MSWDFETPPEFEAKLVWMREFMREEVWPLEVLVDDLEQPAFFTRLGSLQAGWRYGARASQPSSSIRSSSALMAVSTFAITNA